MRFKFSQFCIVVLIFLFFSTDVIFASSVFCVKGQLNKKGYNIFFNPNKSTDFKSYTLSLKDSKTGKYLISNKKFSNRTKIRVNPSRDYDFELNVKCNRSKSDNLRASGWVGADYKYFNKLTDDEFKFYKKCTLLWNKSSKKERKSICRQLVQFQSSKLGVDNIPEIVYSEIEDEVLAFYIKSNNTIILSKSCLNENNLSVLETIAHEVRHAYQWQYIERFDDKFARRLAKNFRNYVTVFSDEDAYYNQFVEKDASKYARRYENLGYLLLKRTLIELD